MNRLAAALSLVLALAACDREPLPAPTSSANERVHESGILELQAQMEAGRLSSAALVDHFLARIETLDRKGPRLNAVIELNPDARTLAEALDAERAAGTVRGPLHGIPVLLKDNIDTNDAMLTTAGSLALIGTRPARDAFIVSRLRKCGAVILGKTNLSEWANFRSTHSSSGWSARGGQTSNAYDPARNPCGSSSGSAVAVAAGFAVAAIGTETDGSIVCPSSINGVVGVKPSIGLVSRTGVIPIAASQDTAGPIARSVEDAAIVLEAIAGIDPADPATRPMATRFRDALNADALRGRRIGVVRSLAGFDPRVDAVFDSALAVLREAGAELVDPIAFPIDEKLGDDEYTVLLYEFKDGLERYLAGRPGGPKTLAELIAFNEREAEREMSRFGQEIFLEAANVGPLTDERYVAARERARRHAGPEGIDAALQSNRLDALVAPTTGLAWLTDPIHGDHYTGGGASEAPAVAGYPHVTVPAGFVRGLPVGLSLFAGAGSEASLLALAHAYEQRAKARRAPTLPDNPPSG